MKRWMIGGGIAAAVLAGAAALAIFYLEHRAEAAARQSMDASFEKGGVTHTPLSYSLLRDRWEFDDFAAATPPAPFKSVRIAHFSIAGTDPYGVHALLYRGGGTPTIIAEGLVAESVEGERMEIDQLELSGVELVPVGASVKGFGVIPAFGQKPASVTFAGLKYVKPDGELGVERIAIERLSLPSVLRFGAQPSPDEIRALLLGASLQQAEFLGMDIETHGRDPAHVTLRRVALGGVAPGRIGSFAIEGLGVDAEKVKMSLASVAFVDLSYRGRSEAAQAKMKAQNSAYPAWLPRHVVIARYDLADFRLGVPSVMDITLAGIHGTMTGAPASISAAEARIEKFFMDLSRMPPTPGFDPKNDGFARITLNTDMRSTYNPETKIMEMPRYAIELEGLGALNMSFALGDLVADEDSDDPDVLRERLMAATIRHFEASYEDRSLVDAILKLMAKRSKTDPEALRASAIDAIDKLKSKAPQDADWTGMLDTAAAFVKNPKTLTLTAAPPKPLTIQGLATVLVLNDPVALCKALGVTAR